MAVLTKRLPKLALVGAVLSGLGYGAVRLENYFWRRSFSNIRFGD